MFVENEIKITAARGHRWHRSPRSRSQGQHLSCMAMLPVCPLCSVLPLYPVGLVSLNPCWILYLIRYSEWLWVIREQFTYYLVLGEIQWVKLLTWSSDSLTVVCSFRLPGTPACLSRSIFTHLQLHTTGETHRYVQKIKNLAPTFILDTYFIPDLSTGHSDVKLLT